MKTFLLLISFGLVTLTVGIHRTFFTDSGNKSNQQKEIIVTFDGYEGGYYYFTDENLKAIQLEATDHPMLLDNSFTDGDTIGETFIIEVKPNSNKTINAFEVMNIAAVSF